MRTKNLIKKFYEKAESELGQAQAKDLISTIIYCRSIELKENCKTPSQSIRKEFQELYRAFVLRK